MTREELIHHIQYAIEIGADITLTNEDGEEIIKALEQENALDKIRAEIMRYYADCQLSLVNHECSLCTDNTFESILRIIDKHRGGEL